MVLLPPYPWYTEPTTHGILTPYAWYFDPMHGILTPLPMLSQTAYPWYIDRYPCYFVPHTHGISNSLPIVS